MPTRKRAYIEVSAALLRDASGYATWDGELPEYVHAMVIAAAQAAEAGHGHRLPRAFPRGGGPKVGTAIKFATTAEDQERYWSAIYAAGSSPVAVASSALQAWVKAKGRRMDVMTDWTPRLGAEAAVVEDPSEDRLARAGAA
jgi:hypothetical protein